MNWGILYGPIQFGSDVLHGWVCGDPERLAQATTTYGLFVATGVKGSLDDLPPRQRTSHPDDPPNTVPPPKKPPRLPCVNSFSADTLVSTASGLRPISTIRVGEHGRWPSTRPPAPLGCSPSPTCWCISTPRRFT